MRSHTRIFATVTALVAGIAAATSPYAATSLYADDSTSTEGHGNMMMSPGMMGHGNMMQMMQQMSDMAEHCSQMMQGSADGGSGRPNEQWKKKAPVTPENDG